MPMPREAALSRALLRSRTAAWGAFLAVHAWLAFLGVVVIPNQAFWDLQLYRYWMWLGVHVTQWPGLEAAWVYPAGATIPMLVAGVGGLGYGSGYAIAWSLMITALDAAALAVIMRRRNGLAAAWWWAAFLLLLGPVAMGRLDAVVAPLVVVGLLWGLDRPAVASFLLTVGAWIKVAPGALLAPLFLASRRPWRDVVVPAAAFSAVVVGTVVGLGGGAYAFSFLFEQGARGLQIESVGATPWLLVALFSKSITRWMNQDINTWEIYGPGTSQMASLLGVLFDLAIVAVAVLLWRRRQTMGDRLWTDRGERHELLVRGALVMTLAMLVVNKVLSPQYIGWLAGPVVVAVAVGLPGWDRTRKMVLAVAGATQVIFPYLYGQITYGGAGTTLVLAARNVALVVLLVWSVKALLGQRDDETTSIVRSGARVAAHATP
ncbi:MAG TPA: glycosyltransferase 87 family protein [Propionicimonas sp.]